MKILFRTKTIVLLAVVLVACIVGTLAFRYTQDRIVEQNSEENNPITMVHISGQLPYRDVNDLFEEACLIVEATALKASESFQVESYGGGKAIYTDYMFEVVSILRGVVAEKEITVRVEGGTIPQVYTDENGKEIGYSYTEDYELSPEFKTGNSYLMFLYQPKYGGGYYLNDNAYYTIGVKQGVYEKAGNGTEYNAQLPLDTTITATEIEKKLEELRDIPIDLLYVRNEYLENQKRNLESGFNSQEEYDEAMKLIDTYAVIIEPDYKQ
jgi:hypothetical protein